MVMSPPAVFLFISVFCCTALWFFMHLHDPGVLQRLSARVTPCHLQNRLFALHDDLHFPQQNPSWD